MPQERIAAKRARALAVLEQLAAEMPEARIALAFSNPLELLVAVMLSAQCTDQRVNQVTPALFARFPTAADYAHARPETLEAYLKTLGLFRSKAKNLVAAAQAICERHGGEVPGEIEALQALPGVGRKTAGVVAIHLGTGAAFPVDTHVGRLATRLGFTRQKAPQRIEQDLMALLPQAWWTRGHQLLVWHGRRTCAARAPACERCSVRELCPMGRRAAPAPRPAR